MRAWMGIVVALMMVLAVWHPFDSKIQKKAFFTMEDCQAWSNYAASHGYYGQCYWE